MVEIITVTIGVRQQWKKAELYPRRWKLVNVQLEATYSRESAKETNWKVDSPRNEKEEELMRLQGNFIIKIGAEEEIYMSEEE